MRDTIKEIVITLAIIFFGYTLWNQNSTIAKMNEMWKDSVQSEVQFLKKKATYERVWDSERMVIENAHDDCLDKLVPDAINGVFLVDPKLPE